MFKEVSAKEMRLLPVYVYGSESIKHQTAVKREKGIMLHSQISLCRNGSGIFTDHNNLTHSVKKGDVLYFMGSAPNSYAPITPNWEMDYIVIGGCGLNKLMENINFSRSGVITPLDSDLDEISKLFENIITINNSADDSHAKCSRMLYRLILLISNGINIRTDKSFRKKVELLLPCIDYIKSNYVNDISIAHMAEIMGITPTYLGILFKEVYGITPQKYLISVKLDCAKRFLVLRKDMHLSEIAALSGFNSINYFCNTFKKYIGMTPNEYRRINTYTEL